MVVPNIPCTGTSCTLVLIIVLSPLAVLGDGFAITKQVSRGRYTCSILTDRLLLAAFSEFVLET